MSLRVGIIGGGQLAQMLALAGMPLGIHCTVLDPSADACAAQVSRFIQGAYDDPDGLAALVEASDAITFDFENVPAEAAQQLIHRVPVAPSPSALAVAQDRLQEKTLFRQLAIATPEFAPVDSFEDLQQAVTRIGLPAILKTRRLGYDGKGQRRLQQHHDLEPAWQALQGVPLILEAWIPFEREVSLLAVRGAGGEIGFYPLVENHHRQGILRLSRAPCELPTLAAEAQRAVSLLLEHLDYVGVLAVEFFHHGAQLLANEMAPRVHNSGHWTLEGAETSQFENHLRAVLGLPLGSTEARGHSAMVNCIGEMPSLSEALSLGVHVHDYAKAPRAGRKVGHLNLCSVSATQREARLPAVLRLVAELD